MQPDVNGTRIISNGVLFADVKNGKHPVMESSVKRQRCPHSLQINIPSSKRFALDREESLSESIWSDFEAIVLDDICHITSEDDDSNIDVVKLYNDIVDYSKHFAELLYPKMQYL